MRVEVCEKGRSASRGVRVEKEREEKERVEREYG